MSLRIYGCGNTVCHPNTKKPRLHLEPGLRGLGDDLLSHLLAVPSALRGLTALFGMGRGGTPALESPRIG